jgi:regulatory protein YycI of two-component signal transduction system YycFG
MVTTYDAADPQNTRDEYVKKSIMKYGHEFNGIPIVGGARGDDISVAIENDEVVGFKRHWRTVVGTQDSGQAVIPAGQALDVVAENLPKLIPLPRYRIGSIRLFYYGLPSEADVQYLRPVWGFKVTASLWVYVDAYTGEFIY